MWEEVLYRFVLHVVYTLFLMVGARWLLKIPLFPRHHILSINLQTVPCEKLAADALLYLSLSGLYSAWFTRGLLLLTTYPSTPQKQWDGKGAVAAVD